jgi:hypothetical protein
MILECGDKDAAMRVRGTALFGGDKAGMLHPDAAPLFFINKLPKAA